MSNVDSTFQRRQIDRNIKNNFQVAVEAMESYVREFGDVTPTMSIAAYVMREFFNNTEETWRACLRPHASDAVYRFCSIACQQEEREFLKIEPTGQLIENVVVLANYRDLMYSLRTKMVGVRPEMRNALAIITYAAIAWLDSRNYPVLEVEELGPGHWTALWNVNGTLVRLTVNHSVLWQDWDLIEKHYANMES